MIIRLFLMVVLAGVQIVNVPFTSSQEGLKTICLRGILETYNTDAGFFVLESGGGFYRLVFNDEANIDELFPGDDLEIVGQCEEDRNFLVKNVSCKRIQDNENMRVIYAKLSSGDWHDGLFRVLSTSWQYWQVNFASKYIGMKGLKREIWYTFKGHLDNHLSQTLHETVLLDKIRPRIVGAKLKTIDPKSGMAVIIDKWDQEIKVQLEMTEKELEEKFVENDYLKVTGYQNVLDRFSPILFGKIEKISMQSESVKTDFIGQVVAIKDTGKTISCQVRSGWLIYTVYIPQEIYSSKLEQGKWFRVQGFRTSFVDKLITATKLTPSQAIFYGVILGSDLTVDELTISELNTRLTWRARLNDRTKLKNYPFGAYVKVTGKHLNPDHQQIKDTSIKELGLVVGAINNINFVTQTVIVCDDKNNSYTLQLRTEQQDLEEFNFEDKIQAIGRIETSEEYTLISECVISRYITNEEDLEP